MAVGACLLAGIVSGVGAAFAFKVRTDFDEDYDLGAARTFSVEVSIPAASEIVTRRLSELVEAELEIKGLSASPPAEADLNVVLYANSSTRVKGGRVNLGVGVSKRTKRGSISIGGSTGGRPRTVEEGSFVIDVRDRESDRLVWQCTGSGTLKGDPAAQERKVHEAVREAFVDFPRPPSD
ncbi:MAG: DUF4136 domain-containing protein [Thermoanaerobaculia bacterium]|nr:DUF4136 domain-containing protein [Thermoanaerobaculia bacterium]